MKAKTLLLTAFAALLLLASNSQAQQARFIEITVSDTVLLKSTKIIYEITIGKQNELLGMKFNTQEEENPDEPLPTVKDVTSLLDKKKFKYTVVTNKDYSVSETEPKPSIEVPVANEAELNKLYELVKSQKGLTGKIKEIQYEDLSKFQQALFKKLYAKARQQADFMATVSGSKVVNLMSVTDVKSEAFDFMAIFKQLQKNMPRFAFGEASAFESEEVLKMIFKFAIE